MNQFGELMSGITFVTFCISVSWICTSFFQIHAVRKLSLPIILAKHQQKRNIIIANFPHGHFVSELSKHLIFTAPKHHDNNCHCFNHIHFLLFWSYGNNWMRNGCWIRIQCIVVSISNLFTKINIIYNCQISTTILFYRI